MCACVCVCVCVCVYVYIYIYILCVCVCVCVCVYTKTNVITTQFPYRSYRIILKISLLNCTKLSEIILTSLYTQVVSKGHPVGKTKLSYYLWQLVSKDGWFSCMFIYIEWMPFEIKICLSEVVKLTQTAARELFVNEC